MVKYLFFSLSFVCIPTEDGWEREKLALYQKDGKYYTFVGNEELHLNIREEDLLFIKSI